MKTTLGFAAALLAASAGLGCATDVAPDEQTSRTSDGLIISLLTADAAGASPGFERVTGFPFRVEDRFMPLAAFTSALKEALATLPGALAADVQKLDAADFAAVTERNYPQHRRGEKAARLVHVYSDAPVYVIGDFALLPDDDNKPIEPRDFKKGADDPALYAFCAMAPRRCIPLSREHKENRETSVVVLAARTIVVKGTNHTDGLSLITVTENLLMHGEDDRLDLSARGQKTTPKPWGNFDVETAYPGQALRFPGWKQVLYRRMPNSPEELYEDVVAAKGGVVPPDVQWQLDVAASKAPMPAEAGGRFESERGLAGLPGGSWLGMTLRASSLRAQSRGQQGGNGTMRENACGYGCDVHVPPGPGGNSGMIQVHAALMISSECDFGRFLRDERPSRDSLRGDVSYVLNETCSDGIDNDGSPGQIDCAASACRDDLNVTVCKSREAMTIDLSEASAARHDFDGTFGVSLGGATGANMQVRSARPGRNDRAPGGSSTQTEASTPASLEVDTVMNAANVPRGPRPTTPDIGRIIDGLFPQRPGGGVAVDPSVLRCVPEAIDQYAKSRLEVSSGSSGTGALMRPYNQFSQNAPASPAGLPAGPTPRHVLGGVYIYRPVTIWTRLQWAIALDRLHPLELRRRVAIGHQRYRIGEIASAKTRYRDALFLLEANQRRVAGTHTGGTIFSCDAAAPAPATPSSPAPAALALPAGLREICGIRLELDRYLGSLERGANFFGYPADYVIPRAVATSQLLNWTDRELTDAKTNINAFQLNKRIENLATDFDRKWSDALDNQIAGLKESYAPGGSLWRALDNARKEQRDVELEFVKLDLQAKKNVGYLNKLKLNDEVESTTFFDDLMKAVIIKGAEAVGTYFGGPVVGAKAGEMADKYYPRSTPSSDDAYALSSVARELNEGLPVDQTAAINAESEAEGSRALQHLKLTGELFQIILRVRDEARRWGRAAGEEELVKAKIREAQAAVMRLEANRDEAKRRGPDELEALLKASYDGALAGVKRSGEYVYLAKRAAERDGIPYVLRADGTTSNPLTTLLDAIRDASGKSACGASSSDIVDLRFDNIDCYSQRVAALRTWTTSGHPSKFTVAAGITRVVPITASMLGADAISSEAVYNVPVDVPLSAAHAFRAGTRTHKIRDITVFLDTGVSAPDADRAWVEVNKGNVDDFWLGSIPGASAPGADPREFLTFRTYRGGPMRPGADPGPLGVLYGDPTWSPTPALSMRLCRGSASHNIAQVSSVSTKAFNCSLSRQLDMTPDKILANAAAAYVGRSMLGHYQLKVPASALVGTSALRVYFQFDAQPPAPPGG